MKLRGVVVALDGRVRQVGQGMADEGRVDSAVAVELFFEGKNHQRFVDVVAERRTRPWRHAQNCGAT